MQNKKFVLAAPFLAVLISGCASIFSDSNYPVSVKSTPDGATFKIVNQNGDIIHKGETPATVALEAGNGFFTSAKYRVEFEKDGFEDKDISIQTGVDGWYIANILFGGIIGLLIIDPITGAMFTLPDEISAHLDDDEKAAMNKRDKIVRIVTMDTLTDSQKADLIPIN